MDDTDHPGGRAETGAPTAERTEQRYRALFDAIDEGFCVIEVLFDEAGRPVDYRFLEVNPAFVRQTGLEDAAGRTMRELAPSHEQHWFDTYGRIAVTGQPERFEDKAEALGRWYDVYAFRVDDPAQHHVAILFHDVLQRKRADAALRASEERQVFLLMLSDALRPLTDPASIKLTAARALGKHLGVTRAQYWEADPTGEYLDSAGGYSDGVPPVSGRVRMDDFGRYVRENFRAGRVMAVENVANDARISPEELQSYEALGLLAWAGVPLVKKGEFVAALGLHSAAPRAWTIDELQLVEEVAERTWAAVERARVEQALQASERFSRALVEGVPLLVWRAGGGGEWTWASPQWTDYTGQPEIDSHGAGWLDAVHPDDREAVVANWTAAELLGEFRADYRVCHAVENRYRWFQTRATPVYDDEGHIIEWLGTSTDVDEMHQLQARQLLLLAELQHRVRNILTVVRSVFSRTVEAEGSIEEIADHYRGRLDSLARTQVIVTQRADGTVDLENLIRDELLSVSVSDGPLVRIEGPAVTLRSKEAEALGLAIHELATNALKYGAIKTPDATLDIRWATNMDYGDRSRLHLTWLEQGVPAVALHPVREGFGMELIKEALPYRLGAETGFEFRSDGICCTISIPLPDDEAPMVTPGASN